MTRANLLGAQGARELIAFLDGDAGHGAIELRADRAAGPQVIRLTRSPSEPRLLDRHVFELAPDPRRPIRSAPPAIPADAVVLTNSPRFRTALACQDGRISRHVRVLVDATDPRLREARWSPPAAELLDLHEQAFLAAKECAPRLDGGSFVVSVVGGLTDGGVPLPFTGLFTGLVKSLALELPGTAVLATVHAEVPLEDVLATVSAELGARQLIPVTYHAGGLRLTPRAVPCPATPSGSPPLGEDSVVVAAGGGRGIGAPVLAALAGRYRPRIVILGSSELPEDPDEVPERSAFIRAQLNGPGRVSVPEANARFDRLGEQRQVRRTLAELERLCGPGRVRYVRCDLRDPDAVKQAVDSVDAPIDLLLNIAGTNRASGVTAKSVADFRAVRDLKVHTYLNLKEALRGREPRRWCNFGSFIGLTGQRGETDYGSANDFLNTAAMSAEHEFTIGWTLWRDIGLGATPLMRDFLAGSDEFTPTPTEEGVGHFLAELATTPNEPVTVFFGDKERAAIRAAVPEFLEFSTGRTRALPYIDTVTRRTATELTAERVFSMDRDGYLDLHQVGGYPTLPGTFVPELAAQAAVSLVPGRVPVVFEDLLLESFLRIYRRDRPEVKRLTARLLRGDERESVVAVRVLGDVVAPNGVVIARDKLHFSVTVRLRDAPVPGPAWAHWDEHGSRPLRDPYHVPGSGVLLREVFRSTTDTRTHPLGRRGRLALDEPELRRWFPGLLVPSVTLDGLVRVAVLERVSGRWTPVAIPRSVRRIDLYGGHTDLTLAALAEPVELYVTPVDLHLEDPVPDNRAIAVASSGEVLLQVKDIVGAIVGYVDQETGEYLDRERFDREERA
jgi:NAD(P)-dependent dehydrogenase (short-subunit alcohol dehydrogenase family)